MLLRDFSNWLSDLLEPSKYKDYCSNGLCVEASSEVTKVVTGVSFRESLIDKAIELGADCIIVHHPHGFWASDSKLPIGILGRKVQKLMENHISLFGFHLPLDGHHEIGNNALIASKLGMERIIGFMSSGEKEVGCIASFPKPISREEVFMRIQKLFPLGVSHSLFYGSSEIQKIGICSGGGSSGIDEAFSLGVDLYLTGEIKEQTPIFVEEERQNVVACGHHRTEIFGVQALAKKIEVDLKIPSTFIDIDNAV